MNGVTFMRKRKRINFKLAVLILFSLIIAFVLIYAGRIFKREVSERAVYLAKILATETANESVSKTLKQNPDFSPVNVVKDAYGKVVSVETMTVRINSIKTEITKEIIERLNLLSERNMNIPLGNLTGNGLLSARGPYIKCRFIPVGALQTKTISHFENAGINQTRHNITLLISVDIMAITSFASPKVTVPFEFILSETVIVGNVPESYTQVLTENSELLGDINDYRAQ